MRKDIKAFIKKLINEGWELEFSKHYKLRSPTGQLFTTSITPNCPHSIKNLKRDIRKYTKK